MFESPANLIAESHFREVAVTDSKGLTMVVTTEVFVWKVNANIFRKMLSQLDNVHMISRNKYLMSTSRQFRISKALVE